MEKIALSEYKRRLTWIKKTLEKSEEDYHGRFIYAIPLACYSDYSGRMVERSNSRYLMEEYSGFISLDTSGMGSVETGIKNEDLWEAINDDDFASFMELIDSLSDYPCLDDCLMGEMEQDAINEAWDNWIREQFKMELVKLHSEDWEANSDLGIELEKSLTLEDGLNSLSEKNLLSFFRELCDKGGQYPEIETGGDVWINLECLVQGVSYSTLKELVSGDYFVIPDAVQTSFIKEI